MPKCRTIQIVLACGVLVALAIFLTRHREPSFKGKNLSTWLAQYAAITLGDAKKTPTAQDKVDFEEAIRHIGTNALPYLLDWIQYERPPSDYQSIDEPRNRKELRAIGACNAYTVLGDRARPSIPELTRILNDTTKRWTCWNAAGALGDIGVEARPALIAALSSNNERARESAAMGIRRLGTNAGPAIPLLLRCLYDRNEGVMHHAAIALGYIMKLDPDRVVPGFLNLLETSNRNVQVTALRALGNYGSSARRAVPGLIQYLNASNHDTWVRDETRAALLKISPESLTNAPPP